MSKSPKIFSAILLALQVLVYITGCVKAVGSVPFGYDQYLVKPIITKANITSYGYQYGIRWGGFQQIVVSIDSGKFRGVITMTTFVQFEKYIRQYLIRYPVYGRFLNTIKPDALQQIVDFRNARLGRKDQTVNDIEDIDFDIYLSDFVDTFAGGAFGSFLATYLATNGGNYYATTLSINAILISQRNASTVLGNRTLAQDLKTDLVNPAYAGIFPNPGTSQTLYYLLYHSVYLSILSSTAAQYRNFSASPEYNPYGDPFRANANTPIQVLQNTLDFTQIIPVAQPPDQYVNMIAFFFSDRKFSDSSFIKSNLYIQTTDQVNSRPLAFYHFGNTYGYTSTNFTYGIGQASIRYYDGTDQNLWKLVEASTAYLVLGPGVSVDLGGDRGTTILTDSGYIAEDPTQLVLSIQDRFTRVPLRNCKVLSVGPGYGIPTMRQNLPPYNQSNVVLYEFAVEGNTYPVVSPYQTAQLKQATDGNFVRIGPLADDTDPVLALVLGGTFPNPDDLARAGKNIVAQFTRDLQFRAYSAVQKLLAVI